MKVLIDAGHGIETPGKRSPDGSFLEYLWNRQVADYLLEDLLKMGIDAEMVVTETNDITLRNRVNRINTVCNRLGKENVMLISVHANAAGDGKSWMNAKGWSCYTTKGKTESDAIAEALYDKFAEEFTDRKIRRDLSDGDSDWEENFYVIQKSACPAVLVENFFYDNKEECKWLLMEDTKRRIALTLAVGIFHYLYNKGLR